MSKKSITSKNKMGKEMTYEEIGAVTSLSPQQVHKIEKEAFNKMVYGLMSKNSMNIFDSILAISSYLGIELEQSYKKLDKRNKQLLSLYTQEKFGKPIKKVVIKDKSLLENKIFYS